jgi:predicted YcjX-like family ATPase
MVFENFARDRQREATIQSVRKLYEDAVRAGASNFSKLHNVSLYVLLFDEDLTAYSQDYFLANTNRRHRFVARHLASLVYEGTRNLPSLIGGDYRMALTAVEYPGDWQKELNSISAAFNLFKQQHSPSLQDIRNIVGAHKDEDAAKQLAILDKVDPLTIYRLGSEFSEPLRSLLALQARVTAHLARPKVMLKEVARHLPTLHTKNRKE